MAEADILKLTNMNRVLSDRELFRIVHTKKKKKKICLFINKSDFENNNETHK